MSLGDLIAVIVAAVAAVFSGLSWWASRRSAGASERSATAAETSAGQSVVSADAAQRTAASAEEQLALNRKAEAKKQRVRQLAARTPEFRMGPVDWRGGTLAHSAVVFMTSTSPLVDRVEVSVIGAVGLGTYGSSMSTASSWSPLVAR